MIHKSIKDLATKIKLNDPEFTNFKCLIFHPHEAYLLYKAMRHNQFITACSVIVQENAANKKLMLSLVNAIYNIANDNNPDMVNNIRKFSFFENFSPISQVKEFVEFMTNTKLQQ